MKRLLIFTWALVSLLCLNVKDMTNIQEEIWKAIPRYEGYYEVSNHGNIRSVNRVVGGMGDHNLTGKKKSFCLSGPKLKKYYYVNLYKNCKGNLRSVHRLVAIAFVDNPNNLPVVNHKDHNQLNNHVSNLEWCTRRENVSHGKMRTRKNKLTGVTEYNGTRKKAWTAMINGTYIGTFNSPESAHNAYTEQVNQIDGTGNRY